MSTVASRTFTSTPQRDAHQTWVEIVDMLTSTASGPSRSELLLVAGVAASVIADQAPKEDAIVVTCDGPRTRIYCIYDDDAIDGSDANEEPLGFDPLKGDWRVSLPCNAEDLAWVEAELKRHSSRITARELGTPISPNNREEDDKSHPLTLDPKGFLGQ